MQKEAGSLLMRHLISLSEVSYEFGLIGVDEFQERLQVAQWLASEDSDISDPREPIVEGNETEEVTVIDDEILKAIVKEESEQADWLAFLFAGKWHFTKSDPDPYPSTPHGHWNDPNRSWPKLNPYTGRAFKAKHQEDTSLRLSKDQMRQLWRDEKFRSFCREHIVWYRETYPLHKFPVKPFLRLPRW